MKIFPQLSVRQASCWDPTMWDDGQIENRLREAQEIKMELCS
jgi:hypothetical protein